MTNPCKCDAYPFPHRMGGGECAGDGSPICSECHQPAEATQVDFGVGHTEAWGVPHFDTQIATVSHCCEAPRLEPETMRQIDE